MLTVYTEIMAIPLEANLMMWDNDRDEPYLILPSFPDLRLTPWRSTDVSGAVSSLSPAKSMIPG